ncbi:xylose isomerase domain-containing protein (plasmid) [Rhizobium etli 8C-3]|uniref:2-keto-myo-inositol dehydratase n=2 Tax=Rhizobium TaxID=379 RepID=A0A4R3R668_9HYPH|nr:MULTISPECIES: TIM barrel protein [Rhizobium]APO79832.1 xylose isomerase domain-containing protein [Rhizobium etli 8C-3]TCU30630.1 2-keto-myo-inositol dehydratase [Rhizobium azibense]TCU41359.1 2-keto-myo-inositol dehydratase [Rhizobium azibense]
MRSPITITTAPCCWGVDDVNNPHLPAWEKVLDEAQAAGFGGLELGPYGYLPLDLGLVSRALDQRDLKIVAGTIFDDLVSPAKRESLLRQTDEICALITQLPKPETHPGQRYAAPYLTVMDWGHDVRDYAAGHSDRAPRLDEGAWQGMIDNIRAIAALARDKYGVRATIHPHAGGYIEFADELRRVVDDIPADLAGLCLDTGHMAYSGMDPVATLRQYWDRVDYIHFKDIDAKVYGQVMEARIRFFDACAKGVMCPIGRGSIDYQSVRALLTELGYGGYITIEQERDPRNTGSILEDLAASRAFLARVGF